MRYAIYERATGRVIAHGQCQASALAMQASEPWQGVVEIKDDADPFASRVAGGALVPLLTMSPHVKGTTISNIPPDAILTLEGVNYPIPDGVAALTLPMPGRYPFLLRAPGYRDFSGALISPPKK